MKLYVGVTDRARWTFLRDRGASDVNFWRPSGTSFKALAPGELFLFKLHAPDKVIVGGGYFVSAPVLSLMTAWEVFGEGNGVPDVETLQSRIAAYKKERATYSYNPLITCVTLSEAFYFPRALGFKPPGFAGNIVSGKSYSESEPRHADIMRETITRLGDSKAVVEAASHPAVDAMIASGGRGRPTTILPRLGQGAFRSLVIRAYRSACALTGDHTLPVLEAAHVKPFTRVREHRIDNGLLLRSDLHKLFDQGFVTLRPEDRTLVVSRKLRDVYRNGRIYYALEGSQLRNPGRDFTPVLEENLRFHAEEVFCP